MVVQCTGSIAPGPGRISDFRHRLLGGLGSSSRTRPPQPCRDVGNAPQAQQSAPARALPTGHRSLRPLLLHLLFAAAPLRLAGDQPVRDPLRVDRHEADLPRLVLQRLDPRADVRRAVARHVSDAEPPAGHHRRDLRPQLLVGVCLRTQPAVLNHKRTFQPAPAPSGMPQLVQRRVRVDVLLRELPPLRTTRSSFSLLLRPHATWRQLTPPDRHSVPIRLPVHTTSQPRVTRLDQTPQWPLRHRGRRTIPSSYAVEDTSLLFNSA